MRAEFQSMNPDETDDSFLLRFKDPLDPVTECILVDCGQGVNVDDFLEEDDNLVGIVITHAHEDHISALPENARKGVPIYTTPNTATILETLFTEAASVGTNDVLDDTDTWPFWKRITPSVAETVTEELTPITDFTQATPTVDITPIPAGHAPGAASYLFKLIGGKQDRYFLATGDFTMHSVGQNPGLTTDISKAVNLDAIFLNSPTRNDDKYGDVLTESLGSMIKHAMQGKKVLVSASSLTGIHYAHWVGKLSDASSTPVDITLAGLTAKLYHQLGYDDSNINLKPKYNADEILDNGQIVITAPEVPSSGGAGEIYREIKDDPNAAVIQVKSGGDKPNTQLAIDESYRFLPHPTDGEIDALIESLNPVHMVVNHGPKDAFKNRFTFTIHWTIKDHYQKNTFLEEGKLVGPSWVSKSAVRKTKTENASRRQMMPAPLGKSGLPTVEGCKTSFEDSRIQKDKLPDFIDTIALAESTPDEKQEVTATESAETETTHQNPTDACPSESVGSDSESDPSATPPPTESQTVAGDGTGTEAKAVVSTANPSVEDSTQLTASDGGAEADVALSNPGAFMDLPDETTVALVETLQEVRSALSTRGISGTVVSAENGKITVDVGGVTNSVEPGDSVTINFDK